MPVISPTTTNTSVEDNFYDYAHLGPGGSRVGPSTVMDQNSSAASLDHIPVSSFQNDTGYSPQRTYSSATPIVGRDVSDSKFRLGLKVFLAVSVVSASLVLALEAFMFGAITVHRKEFETDLRYSEMAIFLALFIFSAIYQVVITVIGLHTKNMLLLSMLCVFYACMLVYTGIQYQEVLKELNLKQLHLWLIATKATNIAVIVVLGVTFAVQILLIYFILWRSVRWSRFKKIGASFETKRLYSYFQVHRSLLIFDFFFFLGFTVQFIVIMIDKKNSTEFILTCCMLPLTLLVLFASDYAATRELVVLTVLTTACFLGGCVYVLFKIIRLYTRYTSAYEVALRPGAYFPGRTSLVSFGVITLIFLVLTLVLEALMLYSYNRGLLPYVNTYYSRLPLAGTERVGHGTGELIEKSEEESIID